MAGISGLFITEPRGKEMKHKIKKRISEVKEHRDKLNLYIYHLNDAYRNKRISYEDYFGLHNKALKERSLTGWNKYYDNEIERLEMELRLLEEKSESSHVLLVFLFLVILMAGMYFYPDLDISGFVSGEPDNKEQLDVEMHKLNYTEDYINRDKKVFKDDSEG